MVSFGLVIACIVIILVITRCSGFTVQGSGYAQLMEIFAETVFFSAVVGMYFASANQQTDILLLLTAGAVLLCGIYFFSANALARNKTRNALICKNDSFFKGTTVYDSSTTPTPNSSLSSKQTNTTFLLKPQRAQRPNSKGTSVHFGMDYVHDHLHQQYRYPMNMWERAGDGRRVKKPKGSSSDYALGGQGSSDV